MRLQVRLRLRALCPCAGLCGRGDFPRGVKGRTAAATQGAEDGALASQGLLSLGLGWLAMQLKPESRGIETEEGRKGRREEGRGEKEGKKGRERGWGTCEGKMYACCGKIRHRRKEVGNRRRKTDLRFSAAYQSANSTGHMSCSRVCGAWVEEKKRSAPSK